MDVQLSTEKPLFFGIHYMACSQTNLGKVHFLLVVGGWGGGGLGPQRGVSSVKVRVIPLCKLFKGMVTHLFQIFNEDFVTLLSIFLTVHLGLL